MWKTEKHSTLLWFAAVLIHCNERCNCWHHYLLETKKKEGERQRARERERTQIIDIQVWSLVNQCRKCWQTERRCRPSKVKAEWKMTSKAEEEWVTRHLCGLTAEKDNNLTQGSLLHLSPPPFNTSTTVSQHLPPTNRHWLIGDWLIGHAVG